MAYKEKDFQTSFTKWVRNRYNGSAAFELKLGRGNSLAFSALEEHQKYALLGAAHGQIGYKIPDDGYQHPFDFFTLAHVPAFVVVREFFMIDIDAWCEEEKNSDRKSLTMARAREIGTAMMLA